MKYRNQVGKDIKPCTEWGFSAFSSCRDFEGTFQQCRDLCTSRPSGVNKFKGVDGVSDEKVGRIMAIWAYAGVFAGTLALYKYLDVFNKDKTKLLIGYGIVFAGLALGSAVGTWREEQEKEK